MQKSQKMSHQKNKKLQQSHIPIIRSASQSLPSKESMTITSTKQQIQIQQKAQLLISDKVRDKIKYLCERFRAVEWSGLIWLDINGSVEDPENLKIIVKD